VVLPTEPCSPRSTQPLKVSTREFSWGKGGRRVWLTTYHPCSAETSRKSGVLTYPEPLGPPRPVAGHLYFCVRVCKKSNYENFRHICLSSVLQLVDFICRELRVIKCELLRQRSKKLMCLAASTDFSA